MNGERLRSLRGGRLEYTLPLTDRHFTRGYSQVRTSSFCVNETYPTIIKLANVYFQEETMSVGCLVMKSGQVVANDTRTIR